MNDRTQYWLDMSEYDLETARAMLDSGRLLYVGFMCHQAVEKALKAAIAAASNEPPYIHNLAKLAERAELYTLLSDEQRCTLFTLEPLNIQARYPEDKDRVFATLSPDRCRTILRQTEELYGWIKATL